MIRMTRIRGRTWWIRRSGKRYAVSAMMPGLTVPEVAYRDTLAGAMGCAAKAAPEWPVRLSKACAREMQGSHLDCRRGSYWLKQEAK